mmetsp:Transcript_49879/g.149964  ORF Transcript_49879/g.149964 Transcript_49879/m.149964 type:complete len:115 (+) Transcript_49879:324-668(+)
MNPSSCRHSTNQSNYAAKVIILAHHSFVLYKTQIICHRHAKQPVRGEHYRNSDTLSPTTFNDAIKGYLDSVSENIDGEQRDGGTCLSYNFIVIRKKRREKGVRHQEEEAGCDAT